MMKYLVLFLVLAALLESIVAPPVTEKKKDEDKDDKNDRFEEMGIEYNRYLVQVVEALESDPEFRKKLENATSEDIQSGKIADELDFVSHNVRTKLDELKRVELDRLRKLARQAFEQENEIDTSHMKVAEPQHLDHTNPHTFEIADLKKLIAKTAEDLAEADRQRREEFKTYEMEKEFEKQQKLKALDEEKQKKYLEELEEQKKKHKKHDPVPLHHPGSKQQLEEVWEKQDHMENQEFDPKAFFFMHDLDGNGVWDEAEVKALFLKELDKLYEAGAPEDDMRERAEELERMREHVFREADLNHDNLISFDEFLQLTKKPDFEKDQGWESLDEQQIYTQEEYHAFERQRQEEIDRLIREGKLQPPPVYHPPPPPGYYPPPPSPHGYNQGQVQGNQIPYYQQQQAYQQQQVYQQQQHFQQQQQNSFQQQQQYQQQNQQHYQQQQYQQPQQQNQPHQQVQQQQYQQQNNQHQQLPVGNNAPVQPHQQSISNNIPIQQQSMSNNIPQQQQPASNNSPQQQQPASNNIPQQQQPISNNIPQQQPLSNSIPQQQSGNNIPSQNQHNIPIQNVPVNPQVVSNEIPNPQQPAGKPAPPPPVRNVPVQSNFPHGPKL